jgi:hypothetical protein
VLQTKGRSPVGDRVRMVYAGIYLRGIRLGALGERHIGTGMSGGKRQRATKRCGVAFETAGVHVDGDRLSYGETMSFYVVRVRTDDPVPLVGYREHIVLDVRAYRQQYHLTQLQRLTRLPWVMREATAPRVLVHASRLTHVVTFAILGQGPNECVLNCCRDFRQ